MDEKRRRLLYTEEDVMKEGVPLTGDITGSSIKGLFFPICGTSTGSWYIDNTLYLEYTTNFDTSQYTTYGESIYISLTKDSGDRLRIDTINNNRLRLFLDIMYAENHFYVSFRNVNAGQDIYQNSIVAITAPYVKEIANGHFDASSLFLNIFQDPVYYVYLPLDQISAYTVRTALDYTYAGDFQEPVISYVACPSGSSLWYQMNPPIYYVPA